MRAMNSIGGNSHGSTSSIDFHQFPKKSNHNNPFENHNIYQQQQNNNGNEQHQYQSQTQNNNDKETIQKEIQQRISEVRNKLQSKRQSGVFSPPSNSNKAHNIMSSQNLLSKSPLRIQQAQQKTSTLLKSNSQVNDFDLQNRKKNQLQRQSMSPGEIGVNCGQSLFYHKSQIPEKKSFNDFILHQNRMDSQDTSMESLAQICNILPDSKGSSRKDQLNRNKSKYLNSQHSSKLQQVRKIENYNSLASQQSSSQQSMFNGKNLLNQYFTNRGTLQDQTNFIDNRLSMQGSKGKQIFEGEFQLQKENQRKSFYSYLSVQSEKKSQHPNAVITDQKKALAVKDAFSEGGQEQRLDLDDIKTDLRKHLDNFLIQNETINKPTINYKSVVDLTLKHEAFTSFAAPSHNCQELLTLSNLKVSNNDGSKGLCVLQQSSSIDSLTSLNKQFPSVFIQSPTPKFSLHLENGSLTTLLDTVSTNRETKDCIINSKRMSLMSERITNSKCQSQQSSKQQQIVDKPRQSETIINKSKVIDLGKKFEEQLSEFEKNQKESQKRDVKFIEIEQEYEDSERAIDQEKPQMNKRQQMQKEVFLKVQQLHKKKLSEGSGFNEEINFLNKSIQNMEQKQKRLQKSLKKQQHGPYTSRIQYSTNNQLFHTHQDYRLEINEEAIQDQNDDLNNFANCFSPMSDRGIQIDKLNLLQRTSSIDHYLSNCTTFLKGQRFLSPSSKLAKESFVGSMKSKEQIGQYFVKLLAKKLKLQERRQIEIQFFAIRNTKICLKKHIIEKFNILNLIREFLQKQYSIEIWKKLRIKEIYKRKGFAIVKLVESLKQLCFKKTIVEIRQFCDNGGDFDEIFVTKNEINIQVFRIKWAKTKYYRVLKQYANYSKLIRRRAQIAQRTLVNVVMRNKLQDSFNELNLNRLRSRYNSLNLNIKEILQNMSNIDKGTLHIEPNKNKLLKILATHQLETTFNLLKKKNTSLLYSIFHSEAQKNLYQKDLNQVTQNFVVQHQVLNAKLTTQQQKTYQASARLLVNLLRQQMVGKKSEVFRQLKEVVQRRSKAQRLFI